MVMGRPSGIEIHLEGRSVNREGMWVGSGMRLLLLDDELVARVLLG